MADYPNVAKYVSVRVKSRRRVDDKIVREFCGGGYSSGGILDWKGDQHFSFPNPSLLLIEYFGREFIGFDEEVTLTGKKVKSPKITVGT